MKLSKLHKTIIIISILLLLIGMFTSDKVIKPSYREQKTETDQEIDLLSIRQDLIENKLYYEKDIENNPTDVENYNSRGYYPSFKSFDTTDQYEIWDRMYVLNTNNAEDFINKTKIKNKEVIKIDKDYKNRLPIENSNILGKENFLKDKSDAVLVFTKNNELVKYMHIDSRIIDFSEFESLSGYRGQKGFIIKLDDNEQIYIDKME